MVFFKIDFTTDTDGGGIGDGIISDSVTAVVILIAGVTMDKLILFFKLSISNLSLTFSLLINSKSLLYLFFYLAVLSSILFVNYNYFSTFSILKNISLTFLDWNLEEEPLCGCYKGVFVSVLYSSIKLSVSDKTE